MSSLRPQGFISPSRSGALWPKALFLPSLWRHAPYAVPTRCCVGAAVEGRAGGEVGQVTSPPRSDAEPVALRIGRGNWPRYPLLPRLAFGSTACRLSHVALRNAGTLTNPTRRQHGNAQAPLGDGDPGRRHVRRVSDHTGVSPPARETEQRALARTLSKNVSVSGHLRGRTLGRGRAPGQP